MFHLNDIKAAHSKVKSGADFPAYVQELKQMGVHAYSTYVSDGHTEFVAANDTQLTSPAKYPAMRIAVESNAAQLKHFLQQHQQGKTDYPGFCRQAAETGVEKWIVDIPALTCTYYDTHGHAMLEEKIPRAL
jgi:uncharacterized protein YbcV (DUF1398 family)